MNYDPYTIIGVGLAALFIIAAVVCFVSYLRESKRPPPPALRDLKPTDAPLLSRTYRDACGMTVDGWHCTRHRGHSGPCALVLSRGR